VYHDAFERVDNALCCACSFVGYAAVEWMELLLVQGFIFIFYFYFIFHIGTLTPCIEVVA